MKLLEAVSGAWEAALCSHPQEGDDAGPTRVLEENA